MFKTLIEIIKTIDKRLILLALIVIGLVMWFFPRNDVMNHIKELTNKLNQEQLFQLLLLVLIMIFILVIIFLSLIDVEFIKSNYFIKKLIALFRKKLVIKKSYLIKIKNEWEECNLANIYIDVACKDENEKIYSSLDEYIDRVLLNQKNNASIALLGDFGTGKTTFLKHYTYRLAQRSLTERTRFDQIPIFVNLKDFEIIGSIEKLIANELMSKGVTLDSNRFNTTKLGKNVVLLLDSFDEMSLSVERKSVQRNLEQINYIIKQVGSCIISCRTHFFRDKIEENLLQGVHKVYLLQWTESEIIQYLKKTVGDNWQNVMKKVKVIHNLKELSQTPLFLKMIVNSHDSILQEQISSAELYKIYTNKLIISQIYKTVLDPDQKTAFMEELAWRMIIEGRAFMPWSELRNFIQERYKLSITEVDRFDNDIRTCSFLHRIIDNGGGYSFIHKSFLEFFVAQHLAKQIQQDRIKLLCMIELPSEIISFLAQLLDDLVYYERLHLWLEFKVEPEFALARRNSASILRAINRTLVSPDMRKTQSKTISELTNVIFSEKHTETIWRAIVKIIWLRKKDSVSLLLRFINNEGITAQPSKKDDRVIRIAVLGIGLLGGKSVTPILTRLLREESNFIVRQNSAVALGFLQDRDAIPDLIYCLQHENEPRIRRPAIWAIESIDPIAARIPLYELALTDSSEEVRQYATFAIGRIGDKNVLEILEKVLMQDKFSSVRKAAIESIGRVGGEKALYLVEKYLNDPDSEVRGASQYVINLLKKQ